MKAVLLILTMGITGMAAAQSVGIGTTNPAGSAILDLSASNKGFLMPVLTTAERNAIVNPAVGLQVYDKEKNFPYFFNGSTWVAIGTYLPKDVPPVEIGSGAGATGGGIQCVTMTNGFAAAGRIGFDTAATTNIGAVDIYRKQNGRWSFFQRVLAPDTSVNSWFGRSIDMDFPYLVVGAPSKKNGSLNAVGKAYIFRYNTSTGVFEPDGQLNHPIPEAGAYFGWSIAVTANSLLAGGMAVAVGAPGYGSAGSVSIYRRSAAQNYPHVNTIYGRQTGEQYGISVDIDGQAVIGGAPTFDTTFSGTNRISVGRAQINIYTAGNYSTYERQFVPAVTQNSSMGYSVKLDASMATISGINDGTESDGYPRIYRRTSPGQYSLILSESSFLPLHEPESIDATSIPMGFKLGISSDVLIVGVPHVYNFPGAFNSTLKIDYVVIYKWNSASGSYRFYTKLPTPYGANSSGYGIDVATYGKDYIIAMGDGVTQDGSIGGVYFGNTVE